MVVFQIALVLCYIACGQFAVCFLEGYCWRRTSERQASRLRIKYMKAVMRQDVGYFDVNVSTTVEVLSSVSINTLLIQDVISEKVPVFLTKLSTFVAGYIFAFLLNWRLAIVSFPFLLFLVIPGLIYGRTLIGIGRKQRDEYRKADTIVEQAISSIRTVYSFVGETQTITDYSEALQTPLKLGLRQGFIKGLAIGSSGINFAIWAFMTYYSGRLVMYHGVQGGNVYSAVSAVIVGGVAFGASLANIKYFAEASAAGERIMEVIDRVPEIDSDNVEGQVPADMLGEVEFKHIEFAYPSRLDSVIFEDFNMRIPAGKTVALVGGSGSGKSTVFALLQRFYNPLSGEILLDGLSIDKLQLKWLRSQMGLVSQEPALFAMTIKENILFGKEDASIEEVIEASKASNAHNFISQLPNGYNTKVGERGIQLSGGQKQRIAVARAIIKSPKILLLDEATSALDSESERLVQEALDQAAIGRTTIVVAHRLSTIRNADIIIVLQNGQVKETGPHDQLMADVDGVYASLVRIQQNDNIGKSADADKVMVSSYESNYNDAHGSSCRSLSNMSCDNSASSVAPTNGMELAYLASEQVSPTASFWRLLAKNSPEWKHATLGCTCAVLFGAIQPAYAYALGSLISVFFHSDHHEIKQKIEIFSLCFLGLAILSILINVSQHYYFAVMGENLTKRIREELLSKLLTFEIGWFDRDESSTGAICSTLARDAGALRSLVGDRMGLLIQTFSSTTIAFGLSLIIAWRLALAMISVQPLVILCYYCKKVVIESVSDKVIKAQEESSKIAAEAVSNLRIITAFSSQDRIIQLLGESQESPKRESVRQSWFSGCLLGASQSLGTLSWAFIFWYGGKLISEGNLGTKGFMQTFLILVTSGIVIAEAGSMTSDIASSGSAVQSVFAVLDRLSMMEPEDPNGHKPIKLTGNIELRDVDFAYPTRPGVMIFQEFSIDIEAGKSTALVGQSGCGKSTIIGLIERFYDPINGTVKIDGRDIKSYNLRSLRMHIALVSQEPTLFAGTIRQNITYGAREGFTATELIQAAKAANAHDFITGLKDGYDTSCGDRGVQLSGGQKQRIAIARAILKNPAILLLDEATSALDSRSEKVVQDALEQIIVGRTSIVVAHRLSTVRNCDMIAVLEEGKVVEKGTHSSLLAKGPNGAYSSLVRLQTSSEI